MLGVVSDVPGSTSMRTVTKYALSGTDTTGAAARSHDQEAVDRIKTSVF